MIYNASHAFPDIPATAGLCLKRILIKKTESLKKSSLAETGLPLLACLCLPAWLCLPACPWVTGHEVTSHEGHPTVIIMTCFFRHLRSGLFFLLRRAQ